MDMSRKRKPTASTPNDEMTPFERMTALTRRIVNVPKSEIEKQKKQKKQKSKKRSR